MATATSASTSQILTCFPSITLTRKFHLQQQQRRSLFFSPITLRSKLSIVMSLDGHGTNAAGSDIKTTLDYGYNGTNQAAEGVGQSFPAAEEPVASKMEVNEPVEDHGLPQQKRSAIIHDFCFGIPYGGLVLSSGLLGLIFSRSATSLSTVFYGGALLASSTLSLKIWRQGKSSVPFILGQAALAAGLIWKNFQSYATKKKLFPTGFYGAISVAMLCFYSYVLLAGGNPPPKKLKSSANLS